MIYKFIEHKPDSKTPGDLLKHYMSDIIYGASDGIITTFTIVSGVAGAKLSTFIIIILGIVSLFGDGISMGASRFLSIRAGASVREIDRGYLDPIYHGVCTFLAFLIFGMIPLISFILPELPWVDSADTNRFLMSSIFSAFSLFIVGSLRILVIKKYWLRGGLEMLVIGSLVAIISYSVGYFVQFFLAV